MIRELVDHKRKKDKDKEKVNSNLVEHIGHVAQEGKKMDVLGHGYAPHMIIVAIVCLLPVLLTK